MSKKFLLILGITILYQLSLNAQRTAELGLFLGRSYYLGEVNPKNHIGNNVGSFSYGAIFRYNLNERYSLKASLIRGKLKADDQETEFAFNKNRNANFNSKFTEISGQIEFNFMEYTTGDSKHIFSPYLFVGLSGYKNKSKTYINDIQVDNEEEGVKLAIPFGPGIKLSIGRKTSLAIEWGFRKTSNDNLDGLPNRVNEIYEQAKNYNKDWYVVSGFMLTYRITRIGPCPVYHF
jgi:hypothetical protein